MITSTDTLLYAQSRIDHYRGRVAATQGAIVNLCDKPLHDESVNVRLEGLCEYMVIYRQRLNYWLAQVEVKVEVHHAPFYSEMSRYEY